VNNLNSFLHRYPIFYSFNYKTVQAEIWGRSTRGEYGSTWIIINRFLTLVRETDLSDQVTLIVSFSASNPRRWNFVHYTITFDHCWIFYIILRGSLTISKNNGLHVCKRTVIKSEEVRIDTLKTINEETIVTYVFQRAFRHFSEKGEVALFSCHTCWSIRGRLLERDNGLHEY